MKTWECLVFGVLLVSTAASVGCAQAKYAAKRTAVGQDVAAASAAIGTEDAASPAVEVDESRAKAPMLSMIHGEAMQRLRSSNQSSTVSLQQDPPVLMRQVIRRAELDIRVGNVEKAEREVGGIVQSVGGYTDTATSSDLASTHPMLKLALRVPVAAFDSTITRFEGLGVRLSKTIGSEDVTGKLVDLDARLKTLRAKEEVFRDMLKNRTQLDDVFNIQNQLTDVRTQIETIDGERKTQAGLAALSTIDLTLEQNAVANLPSTDPNWLAQTWAEATSGASVALRISVVTLIWVLAFCPFWIPALLILRRVIKPVFDKKTTVPPVTF